MSGDVTRWYSLKNMVKNLFWLFLGIQLVDLIYTRGHHLYDKMYSTSPQVGLISLTGVMHDSGRFLKTFHAMQDDDDIKGLIIKIDSGGGAAGTGQAIYREISRCPKPVVIYVENVCASAAYYAAIAGDVIIANGASIVGSIGVLMTTPNVKELLNACHVRVHTISAGEYKTAGSSTEDFTDRDKMYFEDLTKNSYQQFVDDVASERRLDSAQHGLWANGKIFTGKQAYDLGLIDGIGSYSDALDIMQDLLNTTEELTIVKPMNQSAFVRMVSGDDDDADPVHFGSWCARVMKGALESLSMM